MADNSPSETEARNRFLILNAVRLGGVIMVLIGIGIAVGEWDIPRAIAYVLIALGLVEALVIPQVLARMWSSKRRP